MRFEKLFFAKKRDYIARKYYNGGDLFFKLSFQVEISFFGDVVLKAPFGNG